MPKFCVQYEAGRPGITIELLISVDADTPEQALTEARTWMESITDGDFEDFAYLDHWVQGEDRRKK